MKKTYLSGNSPLIKGDTCLRACLRATHRQATHRQTCLRAVAQHRQKGGCFKQRLFLFFLFLIFNLSLLLFSFSAVAEEFIPYPHKTGQVLCYDASYNVTPCTGTGQDGEYLRGVAWPSPRWEGIDSSGTGTISSKLCIRDRLTGLIWQKNLSTTKTTWFDALNIVIPALNTSNLCGWNDWRFPNINELVSLCDFNIPQQTSNFNNNIGFSGVQITYYWSSTTRAENTARAWAVDMNDSRLVYDNKTSLTNIWPVRSGL